jgi:hypothetical protein
MAREGSRTARGAHPASALEPAFSHATLIVPTPAPETDMPRTLRPILAAALAALALPALALAANPKLVRITLSPRVPLTRVLEAGLDVADARSGAWADVLEWPGDEGTIAALGAETTVLDDDPGLHAAERNRAELARIVRVAPKLVRSAAREDGAWRIESFPPEGTGSLGGFWSLAEVKMKLDDLVASDTLGLVADKLDTLGYSLQGRPVWGLKIGTAVDAPDTRPMVYYAALTHAREPEGMHALFHFVDDLLGQYTTDPVARYLLEHRQIYICPVVNPDGYSFNKRIYDSTGTFGFWRKNLRDNNNNMHTDAGEGVDINRNYGFKWNYDNVGSSGTSSSDAYRGTAAWSEPETRIQRDLVDSIRPVTSFSYHTYSDLFVHPWGWTTAGTPDSALFQGWSDQLSITNGFVAGPGPRILYEVNGEFCDWMYGDTLLKPKAYAWTPEIGLGSDGFWPPPSRIAPLNETVLRPSWQVAGIAGPWVRIDDVTLPDGYFTAGAVDRIIVRAKHVGITGQAGPGLHATLTSLDPGMQVVIGDADYPALAPQQAAGPISTDPFLVAAADSITPGRMVRLRVDFTDQAGLYCRDTLEIVVGQPTVLALDPCESLAQWTRRAGSWGVAANDAMHPDAYIADSPAGLYPDNYTGQLRLTNAVDLSAGVHAWAFFDDRYAFEQEYDAGLFEASFDTTTWVTLGGNGAVTTTAANVAGAGRTMFGGTRWLWHGDRVDLSSFAHDVGHRPVWLRWRSLSDSGMDFDGMNFDSLRIFVYDPAAQPVPTAVGAGPPAARLRLAPPSPNPARGRAEFTFEVPEAGPLTLEVLDVQGRVVWSRSANIARGSGTGPYASRFAWSWDASDRSGRAAPPGLYLARVRTSRQAAVQRLVLLR